MKQYDKSFLYVILHDLGAHMHQAAGESAKVVEAFDFFLRICHNESKRYLVVVLGDAWA